uniref:Phage tail collar domain-containing protein n=1 Tax=viral metagenome TaxID=1070528 RepID=A0A6C0DW18_9ZZZZ
MSKSRKLGYTFSTLYLNDGTHALADENFHPVKPSYAGDLKYSVQSSDHNGWLKCDGRSLSRTLYAKLFEVIGTAFGNDDSETFKLPDCRGRVLGTIGTGAGLTARSLGAMVGAETHTLTVGEIPSHTHTVGNTVNITGVDTPGTIDNSGGEIDTNTLYTTTSSATGGGGAHNNMQPTIFISNIFIFSY